MVNFDKQEYMKSSKCFHIDTNINIDVMNILCRFDEIDDAKLQEILKRHNFIFV